MSLDKTVGTGGAGAVFRETDTASHILLLREEGDTGAGVLFSLTEELPFARSVELAGYVNARNYLADVLGLDGEDGTLRAEIARLVLCHIESLNLGPPGASAERGQENWNDLLGEDAGEDGLMKIEDRTMQVDSEVFERGWGSLARPATESGTVVPTPSYWDSRLSVSRPLDSFRAFRMLRQVADRTGEPVARKMLEAVEKLDLDSASEALRAVGAAGTGAAKYYGEEAPDSADRRQAAGTYPLFAGMIARSTTLQKAVAEREPLQAAVQKMTGLAPAALRRLAKVDRPPPADPVFGIHEAARGEDALGIERRRLYAVSGRADIEDAIPMLSKLDPSWAPDSNEAWEAFTTILGSGVLSLSMIMDRPADEIVKTSKGNWTGWLKALAKDAGYNDENPVDRRRLSLAMSDAVQGIYELSQRVLLPLALSSIEQRKFETPYASATYLEAAFHAGLSVVCGSAKNPLGALLAFSRSYVSRIGHIEEAVAEINKDMEARGITNEAYPPGTWPAMFRGTFEHNGVEIRCITSRDDLVKEGREMHHCVGGYVDAGESGKSHFLSVRGPGPEDRSTLQFEGEVEQYLRKRQHFSYYNGDVTPAHAAAVQALRQAITSKILPLDPKLAEWRQEAAAGNLERMRQDRWGWVCNMVRPQEGVPEKLWHEWRGIIGGRAAKADKPGILYTDPKVRDMVRVLSPVAASVMEDEARKRAEARAREKEEALRAASGTEPAPAGEDAAPAPA